MPFLKYRDNDPFQVLLTVKIPDKKSCKRKRRHEAEKTATKCIQLEEMWGKVNIKKTDEDPERRDSSTCEDYKRYVLDIKKI